MGRQREGRGRGRGKAEGGARQREGRGRGRGKAEGGASRCAKCTRSRQTQTHDCRCVCDELHIHTYVRTHRETYRSTTQYEEQFLTHVWWILA